MTAKQKITLIVYAPALVDNDSRPVAVVHGMERAFPGLRLGWTVSDDHQLLPLPQRDAWLAQARRKGGFPLVCNNDERYPVMISGMEISARSGSGNKPQSDIHADLPLDAVGIAAVADVLEAVAEAARAYWGHATPSKAGLDIARQTKNWAANPQPPPRGLPALKLAWDIPSPEIPHRLGWLNYWSPAAAQSIGFPDPARDAELLSRSRRTANAGWVVRLSDAPLDLDNPTHLDALKRAYERFPAIGGRSTP
jgi:hypothetical protein